MKTQVIAIHGGDPFGSYEDYISHLRNKKIDIERLRRKDWKTSLAFEKDLGEDFEILAPMMPNKANAKYFEWKIWFEKLIPLFDEKVIMVGHSLGGIFLAKYLSENNYPKTILGTFLVAAPFDDRGADYTVADFNLPNNLSRFEAQGGKITIYQSRDDHIVDYKEAEKYKKALLNAFLNMMDGRDHFGQPDFPELARDIKKIIL